MRLTAGSRLGRYEIVAAIGEGGMGEVYRAKDLRLRRELALKVLSADAASDPERLERFEREARAVAALNHPGIVVLYSVEDVDGVRFLTMELVNGQTLDRHVPTGGMPVQQMLDVGIALADALSAAHEHGVVHRDLKPGNVMLTREGRVKVLDFGVAKLVAEATAHDEPSGHDLTTALHTAGQVVGTTAYMAPEQLRGGNVDARSDLFALGVVLYELAGGRRPFTGSNSVDLVSAILRDTPPPLSKIRTDLPPDLVRVIVRCLEKDPERRIQTAKDVRNEVERVRLGLKAKPVQAEPLAVPGFGGRPAIAVLPFENRSGDPEQEFFADGLAEDLIARLSLWRAFPVIARNSSFTYKGTPVDVRKVSADLGARYVVQGSVRKAGARVRIAAQLVDAVTAQNVWAQTYDRELTDIFALQDEISEAIAAPLVADLQHSEYAHVQMRAPGNLEAWDLYQRALAIMYRFTAEALEQARTLLERATSLAPGFSTAWARLAEVRVWQVIHGWTENSDRTLAQAIDDARRAVEADPRDAEAHAQLALALMTAGQGDAALQEARRGIELNPSHPTALLYHAYLRHMTGHAPEEAISIVQRVMRLSPRDPMEWLFYDAISGAYFNANRFNEGVEAGRKLMTLRPEYYFGYIWTAMNEVGRGNLDAGRAAVREARRLVPDLSVEMIRRVIGGMSPDVDRRMMGALGRAGLV